MGDIALRDLNEITRSAVMNVYRTKGLEAADKKVKELLEQCEHWKDNTRERSTIKGELSEIALEYHLLWWMQHSKYMACVKSLCIKSQTSNATAEIDILLATPCKVYLFECKSFKGSKTLSKECYLQGKSSEKDVFEQSKYHLEILEQHLAECRYVRKPKKPAYQLLLFELSSDDVDDQREDKWKNNIPLLTINNIDEWFRKEFSIQQPVIWNFDSLYRKLRILNKSSERMFKFHMKKITERNKT